MSIKICITESFCCTLETNTKLYINYTSIITESDTIEQLNHHHTSTRQANKEKTKALHVKKKEGQHIS